MKEKNVRFLSLVVGTSVRIEIENVKGKTQNKKKTFFVSSICV